MRERAGSAEGKKVGEILFLVRERLNDFRRVAAAVDIAFGADVAALIRSNDEISYDYDSWMKTPITSGLVELRIPAPLGGRQTMYRLSMWGTMLRRAVRKYSGPHSANETGLV